MCILCDLDLDVIPRRLIRNIWWLSVTQRQYRLCIYDLDVALSPLRRNTRINRNERDTADPFRRLLDSILIKPDVK